MEYEIKELPEGLTPITLYKEPLLEYVIKLAVDMFPDCINILEEGNDSIYPSQFLTRYYNVLKKDTEIKARFQRSKEVLDTLYSFKIDISKFWYLFLFITDYVKSLHYEGKTIGMDLYEIQSIIPHIKSISITTDSRRYEYDKEKTVLYIKNALLCYNYLVVKSLCKENRHQYLKELGLPEKYISSLNIIALDFSKKNELPFTDKAYHFNELFRFFLKNKQQIVRTVDGEKVSKNKELLVSRLLYISGIAPLKFYKEYKDKKRTIKNRYLNDLLRNFKKKCVASPLYFN